MAQLVACYLGVVEVACSSQVTQTNSPSAYAGGLFFIVMRGYSSILIVDIAVAIVVITIIITSINMLIFSR